MNNEYGITYEMVEELTYGEEVNLENGFTLYHYCEDDLVVIMTTEEWGEVATVLLDDENKTLHFEVI